MSKKIILSLCDYSGEWSKPYEMAGYDVIRVDLQHGQDVRLVQRMDREVWGILAAPPCEHFAASGARWWGQKGESALLDGLSIVDACLRIVVAHNPKWWALENPTGRLSRYIGKASYSFDPCDFGDPWTKRTHLWGKFNRPVSNPVDPTQGSKIHQMSSAWKNERSKTPSGFARAFFEANP